MSGGESPRRQWLDTVALQIDRWGLRAPAIFFLALHRPFAFTAGQLAIFFQPFLGFAVGDDNVLRFARWLSTEDGLEQLIVHLESGDRA